MSATLESLGGGLYRRAGKYFHRPTVTTRTGNVLRVLRVLNATTQTKARDEMAAIRTRQNESRVGLALDPYSKLITLQQLTEQWIALDCPGKKDRPKTGLYLKAEKSNIHKLIEWGRHRSVATLSCEDCDDYAAWRKKNHAAWLRKNKNRKSRTLHRTIDIELGTLSTMLSWAARRSKSTGVKFNPLLGRRRFVDSATIRHCTSVMPMTDEIFHQYASYLLSSDKSRALGWQFLLEALTMSRTCEILACRVDASEDKPGWQAAEYLRVHRAKKGIRPWALLDICEGHDPLRECLAAFRHWHQQRYSHSPWFIPGRDPSKPISKDSLTHALRRASKNLNLPLVTSHGLIAYGVRVHRALGIDDSEISKRRGLRTGVTLIEKIYGVTEPGWFGSRKLDYLPYDADSKKFLLPAWQPWLPQSYQKVTALDPKTSGNSRKPSRNKTSETAGKHWKN